MRDLLGALVSLCAADPTIGGWYSGRVYGNEIPADVIEAESTRHPRRTLVIRMAGGPGKADLLPVVDRTVNVVSYGPTDYEADRGRLAVEQRFTLLSRELVDDVLIHNINPAGGPIPSTEPDLVWPAIGQAFTVKADLLEVA